MAATKEIQAIQTDENIIVSSTDLQRLESLLKGRADSDSPTIRALQDELKRATIVPSEEIPATVVTMNSRVKFVIEPTGKMFELTLVYPKDSERDRSDVISITAPIGSALLGLSVGQTINWPLPGNHDTTVRVVEITYQPEHEGNFHV